MMTLWMMLGACRTDPSGSDGHYKLTLAAYTTPREAFSEILPAFSEQYAQQGGGKVTFEESYQASGAQARAVVAGFEADVVALSLAPDIGLLQEADLVTSDWEALPHGGMITESLVVIAVRQGNPQGIRDWPDLARPGLSVLTPNPRTSGGAMWNVTALWGAAWRGHAGVAAQDEAAATAFLSRVLANVKVMDKGGRESLLNFENGVGDAAITYENEVLLAQRLGKPIDYVVPRSTLVVENPAAIVDRYAYRHGTTEAARALVSFLHEPTAQRLFAEHGYRPVDKQFLPAGLPEPQDRFTIRDLGGWPQVLRTLFAEGGAYDRAMGPVERIFE